MSKTVFVVQTNPTPGHEDEFNDWYDNTHLGDILAVPGFVAAQRFRLSSTQRTSGAPYTYLALYEIEGDPAVAIEAMGKRVEAGEIYISPAMDADRAAFVFEALGDRRTK